jgi:ssDNA-binding Zn-finger/Zn-ribbon topoisomerase 1
MFLDNKYTRWYNNIILSANNRTLTGYVERHHIIPKCLGGSNEVNNMVMLTAREHFVCHYLLTKMVEGVFKKKMFNALNKMRQSKYTQDRYIINSRQFAYLRKGLSEYNKGSYNYMFGKKHSDDVKELLSKLHSGKELTEWHISRIKESNTGINNFFYGKKHTAEEKESMKAAWKNREIVTCPHCGLQSANKGNMNRWHFTNCKKFKE